VAHGVQAMKPWLANAKESESRAADIIKNWKLEELRFELFADYRTGSSRETSYTTDNGITRDYIYSEQKYKGVVGVFFNSIGYGIGILYRFGEK